MAAKEPKSGEQYSDVVQRLQSLVEQLESGGLSLEDSLARFAEGIELVRKGEKLLSEAEKRIEQLLSDDGGKVAPLELKETGNPGEHAAVRRQAATQADASAQPRRPPARGDDDVPF